MTNITEMPKIVTAKVKDDEIPTPQNLAAYVESLKLYLKRDQISDKEIKRQIEKLPTPRNIMKTFSVEEMRVLTETVGYLWKEITGSDIIAEAKVHRGPEQLMGNYWMLNKGVLLEGPNHYTIIKKNINLFTTILSINAFVMHDRLASNPNDVIKLVLDNGGMRMFINKKQESYFQLTDETYTTWGRSKIRKYEFDNKVVKVIDKRRPYKGWSSGVAIIIK